MENRTFEDEDIISVGSVYEKEEILPVSAELYRGAKLYDERFNLRKNKKGQFKPLYEGKRKEKEGFSKIAVYKLICHTEKAKDSHQIDYPECKHAGNIIIDRNILTQEEHDAFLAQPKVKGEAIKRKFKMRCHYIKKYLPNSTTRIEQLSIPNKRKVILTMERFAKVLSARQIEHLTSLILNEVTDFTDIERAINLRREEKKKKLVRKALILRKSARIKREIIKMRKEQVCKVTYAIYEIMKPFLMQEHKVDMSREMMVLSEVLECKIRNFTGMTDSCELVDRFLKNLAKNLAIWMERFITNFGFDSLMQPVYAAEPKVCPCEEKEFKRQLPIDDYIEVSEESEPELLEGEEEYFGVEEWDGDIEEGGEENVLLELGEPDVQAVGEEESLPNIEPAEEPDVAAEEEPVADEGEE